MTKEPTERRRLRNELINGRHALIDIQFNTFLQDLHQVGVGNSIGTDAITIGLGAAGAVASGGTSQILSATSAGVVGLKQSVDKNAFFDQAMPDLMDILRPRGAADSADRHTLARTSGTHTVWLRRVG